MNRVPRSVPATSTVMVGGLVALLLLLLWAPPAAAQVEEVLPPGDEPSEEDVIRGPVSPGGAFVRSLVLPGWGHLASESPTRGAFYIATQSATLWMILKSVAKQQSAEESRELQRGLVVSELRLQGVHSPDSLLVLSEADPRVEGWDELAEVRSQQVEDWVSLGLFLMFLGAADAFVAAHLADYPEPLTIDVRPGGSFGGMELRMSVPVRGRH